MFINYLIKKMSKKIFILLVVVLATSCYAHAQVKFGVSAGVNLANFMNEDDRVLKFKPGFQVGVVADIALNDFLSLKPESQFSQMGGKEKEDDESVILNLNYLQIPVNLQANFESFFVQSMPYLGYGPNKKTTNKADSENMSTTKGFYYLNLMPNSKRLNHKIGIE